MANIGDVAKLAGTSTMTVSRVLNDTGNVKPENVEKVKDAISKLNYRPNMLARGLATKRSHTIALVMVNISDPFHNLVYEGMEDVCYRRGYTNIICDTFTKDRETNYINWLGDRQIDGAVFHHLDLSERDVLGLMEKGVTCLLLDNERILDNACNIMTNNYKGGRLAAEHLVSKGHQRIAYLHGWLQKPNISGVAFAESFQFNIWRERTRGFLDVLQENDLDTKHAYQAELYRDENFYDFNHLLESLLEETAKTTAIYCENDVMAMGVLRAIHKKGLRAPDDLAVIGHDGLDICTWVYPSLTTISQPRREMGSASAELLIDLIEKKAAPQNIILEPKLIQGGTT